MGVVCSGAVMVRYLAKGKKGRHVNAHSRMFTSKRYKNILPQKTIKSIQVQVIWTRAAESESRPELESVGVNRFWLESKSELESVKIGGLRHRLGVAG